MAEKILYAKIHQRNDTAANWTEQNPVLSKGEIGIEIDTMKFKFGDGIKTWAQLSYIGTVVQTSENNGYIVIDGQQVKVYELPIGGTALGGVKNGGNVAINEDGTMDVDEVDTAVKLKNARSFSANGDVSANPVTFNGTGDVTLNIALNTTGVTAGIYPKVTVDAKGRVTAGADLTAADIPAITLTKISDAGSAASKDVGANAGNVPILNSNGLLDSSILPPLAIKDTFVVNSEAAMLALTAEVGDCAIRTDENKTYFLKATPASIKANWQQVLTPAAPVQSVNGKTGVITLTTSDIDEGNNQYYTEARATTNFNTNFAAKSVTGLNDGANVVLDTDTISIDCGNAGGDTDGE